MNARIDLLRYGVYRQMQDFFEPGLAHRASGRLLPTICPAMVCVFVHRSTADTRGVSVEPRFGSDWFWVGWMLLRALISRKWGEFFISLGEVDGGGGAGAARATVFDWVVIRRCGGRVTPMLHELIVRRRRL